MKSWLGLTLIYVGTYYHLGKLHEEEEATAEALAVYQKGIEIAKKRPTRPVWINECKNELGNGVIVSYRSLDILVRAYQVRWLLGQECPSYG